MPVDNATAPPRDVAITALSVHVPGLCAADIAGGPVLPACSAEQAHTVLGRKGLLAKDAATRLGLCAVQQAFGLPPGPTSDLPGAAGTAVVVSSNLGNVQAVCDVMTEVRERSARSVSPLQAPNASSNIIASTIAIRYGFTGPNLAVTSGATSGLDAVGLAMVLLRAGRSHRVVVVGVEPADPAAYALVAGSGLKPGVAAACLVLECHPGGPAVLLDPVLRHRDPVAPTAGSAPQVWFTPHSGVPGVDVSTRLGSVYGALGVLQVATAAAGLSGAATAAATCGAADDGYASIRLRRVPELEAA